MWCIRVVTENCILPLGIIFSAILSLSLMYLGISWYFSEMGGLLFERLAVILFSIQFILSTLILLCCIRKLHIWNGRETATSGNCNSMSCKCLFLNHSNAIHETTSHWFFVELKQIFTNEMFVFSLFVMCLYVCVCGVIFVQCIEWSTAKRQQTIRRSSEL